jgi:cathepsin C
MQLPTVAAFAFAAALRLGLADLPVHCLRHQVAGDWEFSLGPLGPKRSSCGHRKPDNQLQQPHIKFLEQQGELTKISMSLQEPNTATTDGNSGSWTMIYDEGFEVAMGEFVYFAFSKFTLTDAPEGQNNISHCAETQVGWYHDTARSRWGCYVGKKVNPSPGDTVAQPTAKALVQEDDADGNDASADALDAFGSALDIAAPVEDNKKPKEISLSEISSTDQTVAATDDQESSSAVSTSILSAAEEQEQTLKDLYMEPPEYKPWVPPSSAGYDKPMQGNWQESVATALNFLQLGWTASAYDKFEGKTPRQLNRFAGVRRDRLQHVKVTDSMISKSFTSFLGMSSKHKRIHRSAFDGESFDWRNKDGKNFLEPVVTQGDCGSCYTISTIHMLTARNKVRAGSTSEPSFSVSFPLYCSEYNQGCDGGYGFLMSKWNEDVGLVPASCAPFSQGGGSCKVTPSCDLGNKRYRAHNHHYVGGYYGGSDADAIRKELVERGPLVLSFEPKEDFMYYKEGVYRSGPNKIHQEWEQVDHAVLLAGYGVDKDQAYWTLQNSWGNDWGEAGYFRMARGSDESGCESIAVAADVVEETANPVLENFIAEL